MKRKCFTILCVLSLCVSLAAVLDTTEITYMCDNCNVQDICDKIETRLETEGEALIQYYNVCCRHCGEVIFEGSYLVSAVSPPADSEPQADPPADPVYIPPEDNDPPADTATGETPAVVVQSQPQPQQQTQSQPAAQPEQPVTPPSSSGGDSGSSAGSGPAVAVQPQSQSQPQSQTQPAARPEEPVTLPPSSGGSSGSSGSSKAVTVVEAPASQAQPEALSPVVVGGEESSAQPDAPGVENGAGGQEASPKDPDPETDDPVIDTEWGEHVLPEKTRNYAKYPLFSAYYPSRRLNMEGDPDAWANIPGEKIYPISGTSLLAEMLNGGQ